MATGIGDILARSPVIPILTVERIEDAVPLARSLFAGELHVIEITLRTDNALKTIERIVAEIPGAIVGAGTVTGAADMKRAEQAGAGFAVSPGITAALLRAAAETGIPLLPGVATASEVMQVRAAGFSHAKFFPAELAGGAPMLRALAGPFPDMRFCPTGGVGPANLRSYLELPNVVCVGGSWVAPAEAVRAGDWSRITALAQKTVSDARSILKDTP